MKLAILSAGKGTRLKSKTDFIPKCLVEVNNKPIIEYMKNFINKFKKIIILTGYKDHLIKKKFHKNKKILFIKNKEFSKTNMVHSLFKIKKKHIKNEDLVVCYSDIIFDPKIHNKLTIKKNLLPINKFWKKSWKQRMKSHQIKKDAEDLKIGKNNRVLMIGNKIKTKLPKYQFMGIIKILNKDFFKLSKFYRKINNNKIDFTSFINEAINQKIIILNCTICSNYWMEIDNQKDLKVAENFLSKELSK